MAAHPAVVTPSSSSGPWIAAFGTIAVIIAGGALALRNFESGRIRDEAYQNLATVGSLKSDQLQKWRWERQGDANILAKNPFVIRAAGEIIAARPATALTALTATLRSTLRTTAEAYQYSDIAVLSPDRRVIFAVHDSGMRIGVTSRATLDSAAAVGNPVISNFFRGLDSVVHVDIASAVRDSGGRMAALVLMRVDAPTHVYPLLRSWPSTPTTEDATLVRLTGDSVSVLNSRRRTNAEPIAFNVPLGRADMIAVKAIRGARGRVEGTDHREHAVIADVRNVPQSPWLMITATDEDVLAAAIRARDRSIGASAGLAILLVGASFAYGHRRQQDGRLREMYARERAEREAAAIFRATLYSIGDAVITADANGNVTAMNRVAADLTGWPEAEARGRPLSGIYRTVDETTGAGVATPFEGAERGLEPLTLVNHTSLISRDGTMRPIANSAAPIVDDDWTATGVVLVFRDQTAMREQQAKLLESAKMASMGRLAGGIAHDFNNMLSVILGAAELARQGDRTTLDDDIDTILSTGRRAAELTRQLLTFSRRQVITPAVIDLNRLVLNMRGMLERLISRNISLDIRVGKSVALIIADPGQIEQVLLNLTLNARDAMPDGGTIVHETGDVVVHEPTPTSTGALAPGRYVTLTVRDSGTGIEPRTLGQIFEPLFTTKEEGHGTGLGLSTVHGIVAESGGSIDVRSTVGEGTEFTVYLPASIELRQS